MTDALQKLAALVSEASDRDRGTPLVPSGPQMVIGGREAARAQLAALSHLLLPAFEALERMPGLDVRHGDCYRPKVSSPCVCGADEAFDAVRSVLAQLEEALD